MLSGYFRDILSIGLLVGLITTSFFVFNYILNGNRGLIARIQLQDELADLEKELASQIEEKERINNKINLFSSENFDLDLLDEVAREKLAYIHYSEIILQ